MTCFSIHQSIATSAVSDSLIKRNERERQGNRGDRRKIHVARQYFEASGRHGDFFEKTKNLFLEDANGSMCAKF